jgi:hypothetical protein
LPARAYRSLRKRPAMRNDTDFATGRKAITVKNLWSGSTANTLRSG